MHLPIEWQAQEEIKNNLIKFIYIYVPQAIHDKFTDYWMITIEGISTARIVIELPLHK